MATKLLIQQGGVKRELPAQENGSVQHPTQANTHYELLDDNGNLVRNYTTRVKDGKLLIDVAGTSANPDFILSDYTAYFPAPQSGMGSGYFGAAATGSTTSTAAVKASTVGAASGGNGMLIGGLMGLGLIGGIAMAAGGGSSDKKDATNSGSNTNNHSGSQNTSSDNTQSNNTNGTVNDTNNQPNLQTKDVLHGNDIQLPTAYTQALLGSADINAITRAATGGVEMNQYKSSAIDAQIIVNDLNNLSREVQTELSLFVAQLLNPIRKQWNVGLLKVTDGAMNFAQDVANEYTDNNKTIAMLDGHYVEGIQRAAAKYGLNTAGQFYENAGWYSAEVTSMTLDDLKKYFYDIVVAMLFDDAHADHGHAKSLLNATKIPSQNLNTDYFGVDTSNIGKEGWGLHFIQATDNGVYIKDRAKFAATIATPEITGIPAASPTATRMAYLDDDNSHLSTTQFGDNSDDIAPQITQTFTFSQLLEGNVRQLADEYDEQDVLALSQNAFTALNKDLSNLHEHISYDSATGLVSYDADGVSGSISPVAFAQLAQGLQQDQIQFEIL